MYVHPVIVFVDSDRKNNVSCAFCAAKGKILSVSEELKIEWDQESIDHNRFTEAGEMQHQEDIRTANKKAFCVDGKQLIADKKKIYMEYKPYIQPER